MIGAAVQRSLSGCVYAGPTSLKTLKTKRRFRVRDWVPSDGPFQGWCHTNNRYHWGGHRFHASDRLVTIVRSSDGFKLVAPRYWWICDPRGLPIDSDEWAESAWNAIRLHYVEQARWQ